MSNPNPHNQFKPGDPKINRNGRPPREWTVAGLIEEAMEEQDETGIPYKKIIYTKLVSLAKRGDIMAIKEISNRLDGMPKQSTDITSGGKTISPTITVMSEEAKKNLEKLYEGSDSSNE